MAVTKIKPGRTVSTGQSEAASALQLGELPHLLGYALKRAQLRVFDDFLKSVQKLDLTPAQFSVLLLLEANPGRNQSEVASTLGIQRPNFVAMVDTLEARDFCRRVRSVRDRRSHTLELTDAGRKTLAKAKSLVIGKHEARLVTLLGEEKHKLLLGMLTQIAAEF